MEQTLLLYGCKSILYAGVLTGYYWFGLRNRIFHAYNRFYLLSVVVLALVLPLITWRWAVPAETIPTLPNWSAPVASLAGTDTAGTTSQQNWTNTITAIGLSLLMLISTIRFMHLLLGWWRLRVLSRRYPGERMADFILHRTVLREAPFSFFHRLFWRQDIDLQSQDGKQMLAHELTHIRQKHSWDKLFIQCALVVAWFNPFIWIIRRELSMIHEFLADRNAVAQGDAPALAQLILTALPVQQRTLSHHFFHSPIKRRIMMITQPPRTKLGYWSRLAALPVVAVCFMAFSAAHPELSSSTAQFGIDENAAKASNKQKHTPAFHTAGNLPVPIADSTPSRKQRFRGEDIRSVWVHPNEKDPKRAVHLTTASGKEFWMSIAEAKALNLLPPPPPLPPPPARPTPPATPKAPGRSEAENDLPEPPQPPAAPSKPANVSVKAFHGDTITLSGPVTLKTTTASGKNKPQALYVLDGKVIIASDLEKINPNSIALIQVIKGDDAVKKYGDAAANGAVEITSKQ